MTASRSAYSRSKGWRYEKEDTYWAGQEVPWGVRLFSRPDTCASSHLGYIYPMFLQKENDNTKKKKKVSEFTRETDLINVLLLIAEPYILMRNVCAHNSFDNTGMSTQDKKSKLRFIRFLIRYLSYFHVNRKNRGGISLSLSITN